MKHPAFRTLPGSLLFMGLFILAGGLLPLSLLGLTSLSPGILMLQGAYSGLLFCGLVVLLWYIIKYSRLSGNTIYERLITHVVIISILLLIWQVFDFFILYLFIDEVIYRQLAGLIPCKMVVGLLVFILMVQHYSQSASIPVVEEIEDEEPQICENDNPKADEEQQPNGMHQTEALSPLVKITVKTGSNIHLIPLQELMYIQAEGDYVVLHTATARYIKEETMKHLESQLPPSFLRVHRSCIVNTENISRIELYEKQHYLITLKTGQQVRASLNGYKLLKERLQL